MLKQGDTYEITFQFSQEEVEAFAKVTGDNNPVHLDAEFAATTAFKRPIMHGFLAGSVFSRILGTEFPGPGSIYLSQQMTFKRPMYVDTPYKATVTVSQLMESRYMAKLETVIVDTERGKRHLAGEAMVMNKEKIGPAD